jgi:hypothetical protein
MLEKLSSVLTTCGRLLLRNLPAFGILLGTTLAFVALSYSLVDLLQGALRLTEPSYTTHRVNVQRNQKPFERQWLEATQLFPSSEKE